MDAAGTVRTVAEGGLGPVQIASGTNGGPTLTNYDDFGVSVANIGDINRDGINDIAVGAVQDDTGGTDRGAVYIITLDAAGTVRTVAEGGLGPVKIASGTNGGPTLVNYDQFGYSVANIGDINSDGINDIAVGARQDDTGGTDRGAVYILFMNTNGTVKSSPAPVKIASGTNGGPTLVNYDYFGRSVANIGDINRDGINDIAVGASLDDTGGLSIGAVYIITLSVVAPYSTNAITSSVVISDTQTNSVGYDILNFGRVVANIGDIDRDGIDDIVTGEPTDAAGSIFVMNMNADGTLKSTTKIASATNGGPTLANGDHFGFSVANIGDLNRDGITDIAVGAVQDDTGGTSRGAVYILFMNTNGSIKSSPAPVKIASGTNGGPTLADNDQFGISVANIGDINRDGITDIAVGADY